MNKVRLVLFLCIIAFMTYKTNDGCYISDGYVLVPEFKAPGRPRMCDGMDYYAWIDCMGVGYVDLEDQHD